MLKKTLKKWIVLGALTVTTVGPIAPNVLANATSEETPAITQTLIDATMPTGIETPLDFEQAQSMTPDQLIDQLTDKELELHNKTVDHGHTEDSEIQAYASYPNVNNYIAEKKFKTATIKQDSRINNLPKYNYKSGKFIGVTIHETANTKSTLQNEVDFMYRNYNNAFVHAYVNANEIRQTAPANYLAWGAGASANPYFYQIELVQHNNFDDFAKSINNDAYLAAYMLKQNGLKPTFADNNKGQGTIISHSAISKYWGGTNHSDPTGYFNRWGYSMTQFFSLVQKHYNELTGTTKPPVTPPSNKITVKSEVAKDEWLVINKNTDYSNKAKGLSDSKVLGNTSGFTSKDVKVTRTAVLSNNTTHKHITQNGKNIGWVEASALSPKTPTNPGITIKSNIAKDEWLVINKNTEYATAAKGLSGRTVIGNTSDLTFKDVKVTRTAVLSNNTTHKYITQNGKGFGWVDASALSPKAPAITITSNTAKDEWLVINKNTDYYNAAKGLSNSKVLGNTSKLTSKDVKVTRTAVLSNKTTHKFITQNGKDIGWVEASTLSPKAVAITIKSNIAKDEWWTISKNVDYANAAAGLPNRKVLGNTKNLTSKNVKVTRTAVLSNNTTHKFITQNGKDLGWIQADALKK